MFKILAASLIVFMTLDVSAALAQSYAAGGPLTQPTCSNLAGELAYGSRGAAVAKLQTFLVSQNYPGAATVAVTGYFGRATEAAVRYFQQSTGLSPSGIVDAATRATLARVSCGVAQRSEYTSTAYTNPPTYVLSPPPYLGATCAGYAFSSTPCYIPSAAVRSITPASGDVGTLVTLTGSNFSPAGNTVRFGQGLIANVPSPDGRTIAFVVPPELYGARSQSIPFAAGSYSVSVSNAQGLSNNSLPFYFTPQGGANPSGAGVPFVAIPGFASITGPTFLRASGKGTWIAVVNLPAVDPNVSSSVSVRFGDEITDGYSSTIVPRVSPAGGQQALTFTHTYAAAGTYTIQFVFSMSGGFQTTSTVTVVVSS